VLNNTFKRTEV